MSIFEMYLKLGFSHIADVRAYDHIIFVVVLCAGYFWRDAKQVLILVTSFTIGHSITLALATLGIFQLPTAWIEFLIPLTIFVSSIANFSHEKNSSKRFYYFKYAIALFFGLIHGLGFSNFLRALLGGEENLVLPLFSFNIGLEIGQIMIVLLFMLASYLAVNKRNFPEREWTLIVSGAGLGISLILMIERFDGLIG